MKRIYLLISSQSKKTLPTPLNSEILAARLKMKMNLKHMKII